MKAVSVFPGTQTFKIVEHETPRITQPDQVMLRRYYLYYGDEVTLECPTGSERYLTLDKVADELSQRLIHIFTRDEHGRRAVFGDVDYFQNDPHWRDYILFYEYFHGDNGRGVGASQQTDWTGLVASLIQEQGERRMQL